MHRRPRRRADRARRSWRWFDREHLGGAEGGERHRPRPRRSLLDGLARSTTSALCRIHRLGAGRPAVPNAQTLRPQQSLDAARAVPSAIGGRAGSGVRPSTPCESARNRKRDPSELGQCPALGSRLAERRRSAAAPCRRCSSRGPRRGSAWSACSNMPIPSVMRQHVVERRAAVSRHASPSARRRAARRARGSGRATAAQDSSGARRRASAAIAAARSGSVSTVADRARPAPSGSRWGTTMPAPLAEQLDGVRERGRDHGPSGGDGVDQHARRDLVRGVVRQHDEVGRLDQLGQRRRGRGSRRRT